MIKSFFLISCIILWAGYAKANSASTTCPPPCKGTKIYVFSDEFCCTKTQDSLHCKRQAINALDNNQCTYEDIVAVDYFDPNLFKELNPIEEAKKDYQNPPWKYFLKPNKKPLKILYTCPQKNISMYMAYDPDTAGIMVSLYHTDTNTQIMLDSHLEYNLDPRDTLVQQTIRNFQNYLCNHLNPKQFFNTYQAAPFAFPDHRTKKDTTATESPSNISPQKAPTATVSVAAAPKTPTPQNPWRVLGDTFYAKPNTTQSADVHKFVSANKRKSLSVRFSNKKKNLYLQNLKKKYAANPNHTITCTNGTVVFEMTQKFYTAYILSSDAISILITPLSPVPSTPNKQQLLCSFPAEQAKQY